MSLSYAMLGILSYGPRTGYGLKKVFDKSISQVWVASLSQIYRELSVLEKKGHVYSAIQKQDGKPDKRIYTITEDGENSFQEWLRAFPDNLSHPLRDGFMLRIFFGSKLEKEELILQFERFISQKKAYLKTLDELESTLNVCCNEFSSESPEKDKLFWNFTIKRGKMTLKTVIQWAEECVEQLGEYGD